MNKTFLSMFFAGAAALAMTGVAPAADQSQDKQQAPAAQPADANAGTGAQRDAAKDKDAYFAALTKCDESKSVAEKQLCVDGVRKQYGQM